MADLSTPLGLGSVMLRNRIIMPPMANNLADEDGRVSDRLIAHYRARAAGGPAMIVVEHSYVEPEGRIDVHQLGICRDAHVAGLARLARAIQDEGAAAVIQITHGAARCPRSATGRQPAGPSSVRVPGDLEDPRPLTLDEIGRLPPLFAAAARRARAAGFDGVEVHGAHGYLLNEFTSPYTNRRTDEYGGEPASRLRLVREVLDAVRDALDGGALLYRFGADDGVAGGVTPEMAASMAPSLVRWGVQLLDCSGGLCGSRPADRTGAGYFVAAAAAVRNAVAASGCPVPVAVAGGITDPGFADRLVREGTVDAVCVGRAQLADPEWARKALAALEGGGESER
jgi:NADPH2 dehydrogenase